MAKEEFLKLGYIVVGADDKENKLLCFLKENYPSVIRDNEINVEELKTVLGLPIDEKVNGYGLNFVGRNFARAKYAQKTERELHLNTSFSKDIDNTQNLVLKGDNLDSLKILKNYYSGQIKCIYIDPPYNTDKDEFIYPDKFNKEEAEVLGLVNLSQSDFERMDFSFKTKKSHNGWLAFMYPRLLLARDLLRKDGVIFLSIDDNEQANLKLLCDDVFGEENLEGHIHWRRRSNQPNDKTKMIGLVAESILAYAKDSIFLKYTKEFSSIPLTEDRISDFTNTDNDPKGPWSTNPWKAAKGRGGSTYKITTPTGLELNETWYGKKETFEKLISAKRVHWTKNGRGVPRIKIYLDEAMKEGMSPHNFFGFKDFGSNQDGSQELEDLFDKPGLFTNPKPVKLIKTFAKLGTKKEGIILDFFAGSGTTGQAVMQLNAEDGGNRKFILCQEDREIDKDKPAYKFCIDNNLPPVISSITIERLKRAGEKIANDIEVANSKVGLFEASKKQVPDIGFKVFDSVEASELKVDEKGQISITENETDALSRIYNMIFTVGLDEPSQVPEEVVKDSIYKIGNHYYITNSEKITSDDYSNAIKNGKVFIDGWTASLNGTLQNYKEDVKIVF